MTLEGVGEASGAHVGCISPDTGKVLRICMLFVLASRNTHVYSQDAGTRSQRLSSVCISQNLTGLLVGSTSDDTVSLARLELIRSKAAPIVRQTGNENSLASRVRRR